MTQSLNDFLDDKMKEYSPMKDECLKLCSKIKKDGISKSLFFDYKDQEFESLTLEIESYLENKEYHDNKTANILDIARNKQRFINEYKSDILESIKVEQKRRLDLNNKQKNKSKPSRRRNGLS